MNMSQKMQSDLGKLFIGGLAWDTNEEHLHEYFSKYGEVLECVIMKDRATGRGRGFGFVVFADPNVAEKLTKEKHHINGRMVEAKKAIPRNDQTTMHRNNSISIKISPGPGQPHKIFVGGLASTVTEIDFKRYFEQFGTIIDGVVMYDHNTKKPRGFGFITYDSEAAVHNVLLKTFHELNGKMVEVKRAVPKEPSPGFTRTTFGSYPYGLNRTTNILNGYAQGPFSPSEIRGYDVRMDSRFSPIGIRGYDVRLNFEPTNTLNPYRFGNRIGFEGGNGRNVSFFSSNPRNTWGNGGLHSPIGSGSGVIGGGLLGNTAFNLGVSPISPLDRANPPGQTANLGYGLGSGGSDLTWLSERDGSGSFGAYGLTGAGSDVQTNSSPGYLSGYSVINRQPNRGIIE